MRNGEKLVEIKVLVSEESYKKFYKNKQIDPEDIFVLLKKYFDVKKLEVRGASIMEYPAQLHISLAGNGSIVSEKGWDERLVKS